MMDLLLMVMLVIKMMYLSYNSILSLGNNYIVQRFQVEQEYFLMGQILECCHKLLFAECFEYLAFIHKKFKKEFKV